MAIFKHPDGTYHRYPYVKPSEPSKPQGDQPGEWKQVQGARRGIEIHRDGKTMRNTAPTS